MTFELIHNTILPDTMPISDHPDASKAVIALDIVTKYQFQTQDGAVYHEYSLPSNRDIQNCGGYIDKLLKYRSPDIRNFIMEEKPTLQRLRSSSWPVLHGRSPHIDLILNDLVAIRRKEQTGRVSLLDHGCSVAEHFDFIDLLLQATTDQRAQDVLLYCGIDLSPLVLSAAKLFHPSCLGKNFQLILSEGSELNFPDDCFDFSISVGVVNHVVRPLETLEKLLRITRTAFITAIWVTGEDEGYWAFNHSGAGNYFFAEKDLAALALKYAKGRFYSAEFVPEHNSTQPDSYVGINDRQLSRMGSYILVFSAVSDIPDYLQPLCFE